VGESALVWDDKQARCALRQGFDAVGDLVRTGPTLTTVNDIRAVLVA
jgi:glycerate-2-kinase